MTREIFTSFSAVTSESAANGDHADRGWYDSGFRFAPNDKPESGFPCEPEPDDDESAIDIAVRFLDSEGACHPSSSHFHSGIWYSTDYQILDYGIDEQVEFSFHLSGFTADEERAIFERLTGK